MSLLRSAAGLMLNVVLPLGLLSKLLLDMLFQRFLSPSTWPICAGRILEWAGTRCFGCILLLINVYLVDGSLSVRSPDPQRLLPVCIIDHQLISGKLVNLVPPNVTF